MQNILSFDVDFLDWRTLFQHMIQNLQTSGIKVNTQITVFPIMKFWYKHINTIALSPWAFFFSFSRVTSDIIYSREREREPIAVSRWASKTCLSHCLLYRKLEFEYTFDQLSCSINEETNSAHNFPICRHPQNPNSTWSRTRSPSDDPCLYQNKLF